MSEQLPSNQRAAFEVWCTKRGNVSISREIWGDSNRYQDPWANAMWEAWEAATATVNQEPNASNPRSGLELARLFHDTYEHLAPQFGYVTREETREFSPASSNGQLMVAVCDQILSQLRATVEPKKELPFLRDFDGNQIRQMSQAEYDAMYGDEGATVPPEAAPEELTERLLAEADLCRNDGATDIAKLLEDAAKQNEVHWRTRRTLLLQLQSTAEPPDVLRDAERYRYIRSDACGLTLTEDLLFGDRLDMAIDTEMSRAVLTKLAEGS